MSTIVIKNARSFTSDAKIEKIYVLFFNRNECNLKAMDGLLIKIASFLTIMNIATEIEDKVTF